MKRIRIQNGFTLIELLLVIAVLSLIAAMGIMTYRSESSDARISKAALEMQAVLQGAMAYNVDNDGDWPQANDTLPDCNQTTPDPKNFVANYLPNGQYTSPYGNYYCWAQVSSTDNDSRLFWVAMQSPDNNANTAARIAARLPNAVVTADPTSTETPAPACTENACYIRAEVPQPGMTSNTVSELAASGTCQTGVTVNSGKSTCRDTSPTNQQTYQIKFPACPTGETPSLIISPNFVSFPTKYSYPIQQVQASQVGACSTTPDSSGKEYCNASVLVNWCMGFPHCTPANIKKLSGGKAGANYFVECRSS